MDEKEPIFKGIRASNTVATLRPTEVAVFHMEADTSLPTAADTTTNSVLFPVSGEYTMVTGVDRIVDEFVRRPEPHLPEAVRKPEPEKEYAEYGDFLSFSDPKPADDDNCFAYTPDVPKVKNDPIWILSAILDRLEALEDWKSELQTRIGQYNNKAAHRI